MRTSDAQHQLAQFPNTLFDNGVSTKALKQAVRRNSERFPEDFMFELIKEEVDIVISIRSQFVTLEKRSYFKYLPYVFTEQGVAMLSTVLRSKRAITVNIEIMRAFVKLREMISSHADLAKKIADLEKRHDHKFKVVFDAIFELMKEKPVTHTSINEICFKTRTS